MMNATASKRIRSIYILVQNMNQFHIQSENTNNLRNLAHTIANINGRSQFDSLSFRNTISNINESLQKYTGYRYVSIVPVKEEKKLKRTDLSDAEFEIKVSSGDIQLFDVRDAKEIEKYGKVPMSVNIPLPKLKNAMKLSATEFEELFKVPKPKPVDTNIVYYGRTEVKSLAALEIVHKLGYTKAKHYPGGWDTYSKLNPDLVKT